MPGVVILVLGIWGALVPFAYAWGVMTHARDRAMDGPGSRRSGRPPRHLGLGARARGCVGAELVNGQAESVLSGLSRGWMLG